METIHFHSKDERFCGYTPGKPKRFSPDENEITCPACKARDTLEITQQGLEYLNTLAS